MKISKSAFRKTHKIFKNAFRKHETHACELATALHMPFQAYMCVWLVCDILQFASLKLSCARLGSALAFRRQAPNTRLLCTLREASLQAHLARCGLLFAAQSC